jgi:hypothetical protein
LSLLPLSLLKMSRQGRHTIRECLLDIGIDEAAIFVDCDSLDSEFKILKKAYFKKVLVVHPDKGGTAATFRKTQAAFVSTSDLQE